MLNLIVLAWLCSQAATLAASGGGGSQREDAIGATQRSNNQQAPASASSIERLLVMTTVQDVQSESFIRFNRSIETFKLDLSVILQQTSKNNSNRMSSLSLIKKALTTYKSEPNLLIMILDGQSSIVNGNQRDIIARFSSMISPAESADSKHTKKRVVFAADPICWPDTGLASEYPILAHAGEKYLNGGAYLGFASSLWDLLDDFQPEQAEASSLAEQSQQLYFTRAYLNRTSRERFGLTLDHKAQLFQLLQASSSNDVRIEFDELDPEASAKMKNLAYATEPLVAVSSASDGDSSSSSSRLALNSLGNYLAKAWTPAKGCRHCDRDKFQLPKENDALPSVLVGIFIEYPTPFLEEFFDDLLGLNYPLEKLHLLVHNAVAYHDKLVARFLADNGAKFASQQVVAPQEAEWSARDAALRRCQQLGAQQCDYYLSLDPVARLELADTLRILMEANKTIVGPLLHRPTKLWSNFWASLTREGFYARSHDYVDLVKRERQGLWNVPHIMNAYLVRGSFIRDNLVASINPLAGGDDKKTAIRLTYRGDDKPVLVFTGNMRAANVAMHMINTHEFGHLVDPTNYNISLTHPDFYQLAENVLDWERVYLHENYSQILEEPEYKLEQPCQDVFWFPLVSERFCSQLIEIMEAFGQWSGGTNHDPRIEGGYESVPTRDIHMKQVELHEMWLLFLRDYVMPVQLKEYIGYEHDPPRANLAFVVRYHPAEQASLQPHHDSSTYTLNIALNSPGLDYEGGGCRFERYNCSVTQSRRGWALMHPGRLTHYHEGLPVTSGTRYIMVTFVDP